MRIPKLEKRESKDLPPEKLFDILARLYGKEEAIRVMVRLGFKIADKSKDETNGLEGL